MIKLRSEVAGAAAAGAEAAAAALVPQQRALSGAADVGPRRPRRTSINVRTVQTGAAKAHYATFAGASGRRS